MSGDSDDENHEEAVYKTYLAPLRVPPSRVEPPPPPAEPESDPVAAASPPPPPEAPPQQASPAPPAPQKPPSDAAARRAGDDFKNFEFSAEVMTSPGANSGIYAHTKWQGPGWPEAGYELQVINSNPPVTGDAYVEHKMTGSIYAIRSTWKKPAPPSRHSGNGGPSSTSSPTSRRFR